MVEQNHNTKLSKEEKKEEVAAGILGDDLELERNKSSLNSRINTTIRTSREKIWEEFEEGSQKTLRWTNLREIEGVEVLAKSEKDDMGRRKYLVKDDELDQYVLITKVTKQQKAKENGYDVVDIGDLYIQSADFEYCYYAEDEEEQKKLEKEVQRWGVENWENAYLEDRNIVVETEEERMVVQYEIV